MKKKVIQWQTKVSPKRTTDGMAIPDEFVGKFRTRVSPQTPGAIHYVGSNPAGKTWDYHAKEVGTISGHIRWIDKVLPSFTGATAEIILVFESEKAIHKVSVDYDPTHIRDIVNSLMGLGKEIDTHFANMSYWVRKKLDSNKRPVIMDNGNPRWLRNIQIADVTPHYTYEQWMDFAQKNGLEWVQHTDARGKKTWDSSNELKYWDSMLLRIQKHLLKTPTVLPFTYNSLIACEAPNPSGGGNLTKEEIEHCREIWQQKKALMEFPGSRDESNADDILDGYAPAAPAVAPAADTHEDPYSEPVRTTSPAADPFPTMDTRDYSPPPPTDDLPF